MTVREKLSSLAERICAHLKRIENDATLNKRLSDDRPLLWQSFSVASGNRVFCTYISYQGQSSLTRDEAQRYLEKLDAGLVGRHFELLRD